MNEEKLDSLKAILNSKPSENWKYANSILYKMCEEHPEHNDVHHIVAKIWLIGRSYAAAIERRKNKEDDSNTSDDFYYESVGPKILSIGTELDSRLEKLRKIEFVTEDDMKDILETHKFLQDSFKELTDLEKRSLASKYLHFHCPNAFFIFDERAKKGISEFVKKSTDFNFDKDKVDTEYKNFCSKVLTLQKYVYENFQMKLTPRQIDNILLMNSL